MVLLMLGLLLVGCVATTPLKKLDQDVGIVGGHSINITEAPYQVALLHNNRSWCGGSIVGQDTIITAAHCVTNMEPSYFQVRAGSSSCTEGGQLIPVRDLIWNPDYNYIKIDYDIAILWLSLPLEFNAAVKKIEMFDAGEEIDDGALVSVTGWGRLKDEGDKPKTLQKVEIFKVNDKACQIAYNNSADMPKITPRMLCAGVPEGGKGQCHGDSGGPLVFNNKLAGIVSWGDGCAKRGKPGVLTKVSAIRKWVDKHIKRP